MSNDIVLSGNLDMLHSLYDFEPTYDRTIGFETNEYFILYQANTKHKNWWEVINETGNLGFIPSNYVEIVTVNPSFYLKFIDKCMKHLKKRPADPENGDHAETIAKLREIKHKIESLPEKNIGAGDDSSLNGRAKSPPNEISSKSSDDSATSEKKADNCRVEPSKKADEGPSPAINTHSVYDMVESVRINTQLSHEMSRVAVITVAQALHELLPASVFPYLSTILSHLENPLNVDFGIIDQTHDASRLRIVLSELTACKNDSQQRSWQVHEDEVIIKEYILELISILSNADSIISRHVIRLHDYEAVNNLILYYQMETRWSIRQLLLQSFGVLCSLDKEVISIMLQSILPGELARDMMSNVRNLARLHYSAILLTMVFSMGERMPLTHNDIVGVRFIKFLLVNIEYPPDEDVDDRIAELFLNLVLSYNLQFKDGDDEENFVLDVLETLGLSKAKGFYERVLMLLNREKDPVRIFDHEPAPPHSLIKLFLDLLSRPATAAHFYSNDTKVLIDIVLRNLTDLSPGDKTRCQYLEMCRRIMRNTNYEGNPHRMEDILKCFHRIFVDDNELSKGDQQLIRDISKEFPHFFK